MYVSDKLPHGYVVIGCYMGNDGIMYPTIPLFVKKKKEAASLVKVRLNEQMEEYQENKDRFTNLSSSVRKDDAVIYGTIKSTLPSDEGDEEEPETVCLAHYNFVSTLWVSDASNPSSIWYADLHKKEAGK